jgi:hypothetical protein
MINFLHHLALSKVEKRHFFRRFFGEIILKIITSVPDPGKSQSTNYVTTVQIEI